MRLEAHDHEVNNEAAGTLTARLKNGVDYTFQVEMHVQEWLRDFKTPRRFYAFDDGTVLAVYARDEKGSIYYVGRDKYWDGKWELPFLYLKKTDIETAMIGREVKDFAEAAQWAEEVLAGKVATAVAIDEDGVLAAWERNPSGIMLMTKSPRPLPSRQPASAVDLST